MHSFWLIVFIISAGLILHTYLVYPVLMLLFFSREKKKVEEYSPTDQLPQVGVLIAAYNEEKVIEEKIRSVFNTTYPLDKIKVYLGSDASEDNTETIVERLEKEFPNLRLVRFSGRVGKISIINHLQSLGEESILIMTDANVIFQPETIFELVKKFRDERVGLVAANISKVSAGDEGIVLQEKKYLTYENAIKSCESNAFNIIMGAEGGCYAIRNNLFSKVPHKFNVDDFYITMQVIIRGKFTLLNRKAVCTEDVASGTAGEYRRKVRISSGNFQNLFFFKRLLLSFWKPIGFIFWSHKVLRWFTPFLLFIALLSSGVLATYEPFFIYLFSLQLLGFLSPLLNHLLHFRNAYLKFLSHFYLMNFALLQGFFLFVRGIKTSVWQPVKRNV